MREEFKNIFSPVNLLTYQQQKYVNKIVGELIEDLDEGAIQEIYSGNETDVEMMLNVIYEETTKVLINNTGKIKNSSFGYLDRLTENLDFSLKKLVFNYFVLTTLPDFELNWHHIEWGNLCQIYKWLCIIAARDHSKSFTFSKAYPLWRLYRYTKPIGLQQVNRELRMKKGMLINSDFSLAKEFLAGIKEEIEENPILREALYPRGTTDSYWGALEIKCLNGAELQARTVESRLRGRHPDWMVIDDILTDAQLTSSEIREGTKNFFHSVIMNLIVPGGPVVVVGTPFSNQDLYSDLKTKKTWKVFEYPVIFPDGTLLWENRYNLPALLEKKESQGSLAFSREILCKPISSESTIFPYHMLEKCFSNQYVLVKNYFSHPKQFSKIVVGCDFAISGEVAADFTVHIVLGVDGETNKEMYYLLDIWREKGVSHNQQIMKLREFNSNFNPIMMMGEDNAFQKILIKMAQDEGLPMVGRTTGGNKYDFKSGLPALSVLFEQQRIILPRGDQYSREMTDLLVSEFSSIAFTDKGLKGTTGHDDIPMAFWEAISAAKYVNQDFSYDFI